MAGSRRAAAINMRCGGSWELAGASVWTVCIHKCILYTMYTMSLQETLLRASWCLCVDGVYNTWSLESWFCVRTVYTIHNVYNVSWELADACAWTVYIQLYMYYTRSLQIRLYMQLVYTQLYTMYIMQSLLRAVDYYYFMCIRCIQVSWEWSCVQRWELYAMCTNTLYSIHSTLKRPVYIVSWE